MPEPIVYFRGFPSSWLPGMGAGKDMINDLKLVSELTDEQVQKLCRRLAEAIGYLDPKSLLSTIREVVPETNKAEAVRRALQNLRPSNVNSVLTSLRSGEVGKLDERVHARLKEVLNELIRPYPALERYRNAERLATLTGQQLEAIELICDLRPVFDGKRQNVEGMIPYTRLHVVAEGEDGLPRAFEAELTLRQVNDLADKAERAKNKLLALRQAVNRWVPEGLPNLPMTRPPSEAVKDD